MKHRVLTTILSVILIIFVVYQLFASLYNPVTTEIVNLYETIDGISITGVMLRDETLVKNAYSGTMHFNAQDGERVSKNGTIADVFGTAEQSFAASEIAAIQKEIANIEEIEKYNDLNAVDLSLINSKLYGELNSIIRSCATGKYSGLSENSEMLLNFMNRKQIATGQVVDFSKQLAELNERLNNYKSTLGTPVGSIKAEKSGYFLSTVDGYEEVLNVSELDKITPEFLEGLTPSENKDSSVIGKLVSDYTWYIAASVSISDSLQFKVGDNLKILTGLGNTPEISVTVQKINMSVSDDKAVVIFSCNQINSELSTIRTASMTVVKNRYSGLRVSSKALRFKNEQTETPDGTSSSTPTTGVYVLSGMTAHFVPVNIVYSASGYAICEVSKEDGALKLYDEIIVKGKNIYDGKIID